MRGLLQHWTESSRKVSLEEQKAQKQDRFLRGRQIAYLIYEYFRVTEANDSVENYAELFTISLRNDDIQEFGSKWDGILLSMTKIPPDDTLEGLYKLRIRGYEKLKTVLELYDLETHKKKLGPDYHRLKAMVKRSLEQYIRNKNFAARHGNYERNAVVKNPAKSESWNSPNLHCLAVFPTWPSIRIPSWEKPGRTFRIILQEVSSGRPDRSYVSISVFHSWEDQTRSSSHFE